MKFGFQVTEEDNGYFYMKWSNPDIRFYDGGSLLDKMYRGKIYNGDKIKKIVSTYVNVEGNDMVQFAKENIKNKDRYILDYVSIDKLLERDSSLKSFVDDEQQYNHSPTEKEATSPILLGDGWDNEINVVVDGYHRVLEAVNNKQEKILAFIKVYENDYLNSGNYLRFDNGGGIKSPIYTAIFINKDDLINKYQPIHKNIFYHHSTIEFRPQDISNFPTGKEVKLNIIGRLTTDKVDVLLVDSPLSKKKHPHITLSTAEGINPMQGDIEIAENLNKIIKMNDSVNGVYDIFYGEDIKTDKMLDGGQTDFKYYLVVKNDKPVFRTKFTGHSDKTEKDMVDMLDKLIDLHYELKPITENEYKEFKYNDVDKKDLAEFTENWTYFRNGGQIKQDNKIVFKRNRLPRKDIYEFAKMVKEKYPKVWAKGGNIFGNEAFVRLERVFKRGYWLPSEEWMQIKWQSYIARHHKDFRIEGVVAMLKWIATTDKGWRYMKNLLNEEIEKQYPTVDDNYKNGGQLDGKCSVGTKVQSLIFQRMIIQKKNL
ncbi:MAG: hypothetical protein IPJ01_11550 [Micavibrio sp.]|nr:hypothetical protein [Micavibrio sp.]